MDFSLNIPENMVSNVVLRAETPRPPAHPYHHGDLRNALLLAARAMLAEDPSTDLSLRAVARAAGVSHAAPYRHFANQNALLVALACEGFTTLAAAMVDLDDAAADVRVAGLCRAYFEFVLQNRAWARLMFGPTITGRADYPELSTAVEGVVTQIGRVLAAPDLALSAFAIVQGFVVLFLDEVVAVGREDRLNAMSQRAEVALSRLVG